MITRQLICYTMFLFSSCVLSKIPQFKYEEAIFESSFESIHSFISYVVIEGKRYIIKQKKDTSKAMIAATCDALGAYIGHDFHITNEVKIITYKDAPATLHTIVPGKMIRDLIKHKYKDISLKQACPYENVETVTGCLNEKLIHQLTWHRQLPIIEAFNLFICNPDCHRKNIFYDEKTDSFHVIDMDNIYYRNLPAFACKKLHEMIYVYKKKFSEKEMKAFKIVKNTLEFLSQKYPAHKIIDRLYKFARQAGYVDDGSLAQNNIKSKLKNHEKFIEQSCVSTHELIALLDVVINNFDKSKIRQ